MLPQGAMPELPRGDPALFTRGLAGRPFEFVAISSEDRQRAEMYQSDARRSP
jgi:hypothetical protein